MTADTITRLLQLGGIIRLTHSVDLARACSITGLEDGTFRKAFAALRPDTSFRGTFVSPNMYVVHENIEGFVTAISTKLLAITGYKAAPPVSMETSPPILPSAIIARMEKMFKASRRIKIDDACAVLGIQRPDLLAFVVDFSSTMGVKVDGDYLTVGDEVDTSTWLDQQFSDWDAKERRKEGKME
jgi:hypothetical protein